MTTLKKNLFFVYEKPIVPGRSGRDYFSIKQNLKLPPLSIARNYSMEKKNQI